MKIRTGISRIIITTFFAIGILSTSSQSIPYEMPPTYIYPPDYYSPVYFSGNYSSYSYNFYAAYPNLNATNVSSNASYNIKGKYAVQISEGSSAGNFNSGFFHAFVDPSAIEVVSFHSNGFANIPKYDKFELGIRLPEDLTKKVDDFFGDYISGAPNTNGYGCDFNNANGNLNPYDPEKISVEATFSGTGEPQTIYGFYYREYKYSTGDPAITAPTYDNTKWIENTELRHHWRVRFAPKVVGTYQVTWVIKVNGVVAYTDNVGQSFTVVNSNNKGFLKIGNKGKYMVTEPDLNGQQESILPIGVCHTAPLEPFSGFNEYGTPALRNKEILDYPECYGSCGVMLHYPKRYWHHRNRTKTKLAEKGANLLRFTAGKNSYGPELENAVIYDADKTRPIQNDMTVQLAQNNGLKFPNGPNGTGSSVPSSKWHGTNRQAILWELDRMLDMATEETAIGNDIYFQIVLEGTDEQYTKQTWETWHPYVKDGIILNHTNSSIAPAFTDPNAVAAYKKKLRYLIARYGYSPQIACFELFNEYDNLKDQVSATENINTIFTNWLETMVDYIKTELKHKDHLLTASYRLGTNNVNNAGMTLDFMSGHPYHEAVTDDSWFRTFDEYKSYNLQYSMPYQAGEMGIMDGSIGGWNPQIEFMNPTLHSLLWSTTFAGSITSGLEYWDFAIEDWSNHHYPDNIHFCGNAGSEHFAPLRAFIAGVDFDGGNYVAKHFTNYPSPLEVFQLVDNGGTNADHVIGYVRNKTFWWSNFANSNSGQFYDSKVVSYAPSNPGIVYPNSNLGLIKIEGLDGNESYDLDWYNTYINPEVADPLISHGSFQAPNNGIAFLQPPNFGDCQNQEFGFKIKRSINVGRQLIENPDSIIISSPYEKNEITGPLLKNKTTITSNLSVNKKIWLYPNPGKGIYLIRANLEDLYTVEVFNTLGALVKAISFEGTEHNINIENLNPGVYQFVVRSKNNPAQSIKVIKE